MLEDLLPCWIALAALIALLAKHQFHLLDTASELLPGHWNFTDPEHAMAIVYVKVRCSLKLCPSGNCLAGSESLQHTLLHQSLTRRKLSCAAQVANSSDVAAAEQSCSPVTDDELPATLILTVANVAVGQLRPIAHQANTIPRTPTLMLRRWPSPATWLRQSRAAAPRRTMSCWPR